MGGRSTATRQRNNERGVALILALLVLTLLVAIILEFDAEARRELKEAAAFRDGLKATVLSRAAVQAVRALLKEDARRKQLVGLAYDGPGDLWSSPLTNYPLGDGVLSGRIEDERGKLNLNVLAAQAEPEVRKASILRLKRLFELAQVDPLLVDAVADWVDADEFPEPNGAESVYYQSLKPPYRAANAPLQTVAELHLIKGFTDDVVRRLVRYVTVYPTTAGGSDGWINLNAAEPLVIQALDPRITLDLAQAIAQGRPYRTLQEPDRVTGFEPLAKALRLTDAYRVKSDTFSVTGTVTINDVTKSVRIVLQRYGTTGDSSVVYFRTE